MSLKYGIPKTVQCMHCGADNPPTAYCCLSCFKVMKSQAKVPFWKIRFQPTIPGIVIVLAVFLVLVVILKHWMENIDAQITMNFKSVEYSMSFMADKRRKKALLNVSPMNSTPIEAADNIEKEEPLSSEPKAP